MSHKIEVNDVLTIEFRLDNRRRTRIVKTVRVMHVMGGTIGAEFRERQAYSTELTYYLNASNKHKMFTTRTSHAPYWLKENIAETIRTLTKHGQPW